MEIKSVIIDNIHNVNFITFDMSILFFSIFPAEIGVRLLHPCILSAVKYGIFKHYQLLLSKLHEHESTRRNIYIAL